MTSPGPSPEWTFLSNHAHVLHCIYLSPEIRIRDIAIRVEITERAVQRIVFDLERGGYLIRERVGRQNHYRIQPWLPLRHPMERHVEVGRLLAALQSSTAGVEKPARRPQQAAAHSTRRPDTPVSRAGRPADSRLKKKPGKSPKRAAKPRP